MLRIYLRVLGALGPERGLAGLLAFLWSMKSRQLEDLDGAAERILHQVKDAPLPAPERTRGNGNDIKERPWE